MNERLCLLTVHAHPDDEASKGAPSIARYHAEGVRTVLVCCTGGEEGEILNPAMDRPEMVEQLAEIRRAELARAAEVIGYDEVVMLGYRDSGMKGSEANAHPNCFANADLDEAVDRLIRVIRRERPQVMVTYPQDQGNYQHPDHIRVYDISVPAFEKSGDAAHRPDLGEPWTPQKLYYTMWSRARVEGRHKAFLELGLDSPYDERWFRGESRDHEITTQIPVEGFIDARIEGLKAHATQIDPESSFWFGLPDEVERAIHPYDDYVLARGPGPAERPERDLFAGVRVAAQAPPSEYLSEPWLSELGRTLTALDLPAETSGVIQMSVTGTPAVASNCHAAFEGGRLASLGTGRHGSPDVAVTWSYRDFEAVWSRARSFEAAYMRGEVRVEGDHALLFDTLSRLASSPPA